MEKCVKCGKKAVAYVVGLGGYVCQECWDSWPESANMVGDYID